MAKSQMNPWHSMHYDSIADVETRGGVPRRARPRAPRRGPRQRGRRAEDPAGRGDVTITLRRGAELGLRRKWTGRGREGGAVSAIDRVPTTAPIWLAEPVAPGGYQLELRAGGSVLVQQPLQLTATAQVVQVTVF